MSETKRYVPQTMNAVREYYDRLLVIAAAALLVISSILVWQNAIRFNSQLDSTPSAHRSGNASPLDKARELETAIARLHQPPQWTFSGRSGLFVPEKHFIDANGLLTTLETTELHPPVPNEWLEQFGLPIAEGDVLEQDPDKDGFDNLDEWAGHTDPTDLNSHPEYYTKLKLESASEQPFRLLFSSWVEDTYAINTIDLKQPTQFVKIGDPIRGTRFKAVKFTEKYQPNRYGTNVDVSELTLEQEETHAQLVLVKERVATSPESVATMVYTYGGRQEFQVRKDQEFSLKPQEHIKYKLIEVGPAKAVIVDSQRADEPIEIGRAQQ